MVELLRDGKKDRALLALKKKKLHERNALQIDNNVLLLDERVAALETTAQQADLVGALKAANSAMQAMQSQLPLEDVEKLLQDNAEAAEYVVCVALRLKAPSNNGESPLQLHSIDACNTVHGHLIIAASTPSNTAPCWGA